jgi:hypothetical protein
MSNVFRLPTNPRIQLICPTCEANKWGICITNFDLQPPISATDLECLECGFVVGVLLIIPTDDDDDDSAG